MKQITLTTLRFGAPPLFTTKGEDELSLAEKEILYKELVSTYNNQPEDNQKRLFEEVVRGIEGVGKLKDNLIEQF